MPCFPGAARWTPPRKSRGPRGGSHVSAGCLRERQQARCPNCHRRESRCGSRGVSLGFPEGKFWFGAVREALQVGVVLKNDQRCCEECAEVDHQWWRVPGRPQEVHQQRHRRRCGYGAERNVAPRQTHQNEYEQRAQSRQRGEHQENAQRSCNAFAALEFQPNRKTVAEKSGNAGERHGCRALVGEATGKPYGRRAFCSVEHERQDSGGRAYYTRDVGRTDVAAARFPDIAARKQFCQDQAERNRAEQISGGQEKGGGRREERHAALSLRCKAERLQGSVLRSGGFQLAFDEMNLACAQRAKHLLALFANRLQKFWRDVRRLKP